MNYQLIRQNNYSDFNTAIKNFLTDNWELYGSLIIQKEVVSGVESVYYYQAVVKK